MFMEMIEGVQKKTFLVFKKSTFIVFDLYKEELNNIIAICQNLLGNIKNESDKAKIFKIAKDTKKELKALECLIAIARAHCIE